MYEIYDHHADEYERLVEHEDRDQHLRHLVRDECVPRGGTVVEAGIGTGRVTSTYVDLVSMVFGFDRSASMLRHAQRNLAQWSTRVRLSEADHRHIPLPDASCDVFLEGWAFGHVVVDNPTEVPRITAELVAETLRLTRDGGRIVLIETLGTNVDSPHPPERPLRDFYHLLESEHGFTRRVISTDYQFDDARQAETLCRFFFGDRLGDAVRERVARQPHDHDAGVTIPEFTGIWALER